MSGRALVLGALVVAALAVAALRIDLLRVRYGYGEALEERAGLEERHRELRARIAELRDPARLARLAREAGFVRPVRIVHVAPDGEPR